MNLPDIGKRHAPDLRCGLSFRGGVLMISDGFLDTLPALVTSGGLSSEIIVGRREWKRRNKDVQHDD